MNYELFNLFVISLQKRKPWEGLLNLSRTGSRLERERRGQALYGERL